MILGGGNTYSTLAGSGRSATALTDLIDLRDPNPHWVPGPDLPRGVLDDGSLQARGRGSLVSAVALPDGRVLETGGSMHMRADDVHEASIFDPATNTFTPVNADPVGRDYHSEALLLPDGRRAGARVQPGRRVGNEMRVSVYEPPYLFRGPRPVLTRRRWGGEHGRGRERRAPGPPSGSPAARTRLQYTLLRADRLGDADPPSRRHALIGPQPARGRGFP